MRRWFGLAPKTSYSKVSGGAVWPDGMCPTWWSWLCWRCVPDCVFLTVCAWRCVLGVLTRWKDLNHVSFSVVHFKLFSLSSCYLDRKESFKGFTEDRTGDRMDREGMVEWKRERKYSFDRRAKSEDERTDMLRWGETGRVTYEKNRSWNGKG